MTITYSKWLTKFQHCFFKGTLSDISVALAERRAGCLATSIFKRYCVAVASNKILPLRHMRKPEWNKDTLSASVDILIE